MANPSYLKSILASILTPAQRPAWNQVVQYLCTNLNAGRVVPGATQVDRGANLLWFPVMATTPSTPGETFTVAHGLNRIPYAAYPVLPLNVQGAQLVPLTTVQPADSKKLYLSSTVADAPIYLMVEG